MRYYPFNIGDYESHTQHLSMLEDLAYRRLLDHLYKHEKPLAGDAAEIARTVRMCGQEVVVDNVLREFFRKTSRGWTQKRAKAEIRKCRRAGKLASKAGKKSGVVRRERSFNGRSTNLEPSKIQDPRPNTQQVPEAVVGLMKALGEAGYRCSHVEAESLLSDGLSPNRLSLVLERVKAKATKSRAGYLAKLLQTGGWKNLEAPPVQHPQNTPFGQDWCDCEGCIKVKGGPGMRRLAQ